jgi:hypothetical protein
MKKLVNTVLIGGMFLFAPVAFFVPVVAEAASPKHMTCGELWYARNSIFAEEGYCFRSGAALRTFGRRCYPPYGRLNRWEKSRVSEIKYWERVKGCR